MRRGIVHLGIGAFHRAHQSFYTDIAMAAGDRDWAITGVSLRSPAVQRALAPQDGLYTLTERSGEGSAIQMIGAVREVLVAPMQRNNVVEALADPATRIVTLTVTEKGYCRLPDGSLDIALAASECSIYALLGAAMERRKAAGAPGLSLVSCDNLAGNGAIVEAAMQAYVELRHPGLAGWFARECTCPATMVDRIVPATEAAQIAALEREIGLRDEGAVITEPYRQWVIEDRFSGPRPRWEAGGAQFTANVGPFEKAKLRMLNGAHSALAYLGIQRGHAFVHEAIRDPGLRPVIERLMRCEAAASLDPAPGQDLPAYADALLARFANAALPHRLAQIAIDGSQKIGPRWLVPLAINSRRGLTCPATLEALAAWIAYVRGDGMQIDDPLAGELAGLWRTAGSAGIVKALFGPGGLFASTWTADDAAARTLDLHLAPLG